MTEITQADRDAADEIMEEVDACGCKLCGMRVYEALARHRLEERAAIVAWLHEQWVTDATDNIDVFDMIDGIKAGEHLK